MRHRGDTTGAHLPALRECVAAERTAVPTTQRERMRTEFASIVQIFQSQCQQTGYLLNRTPQESADLVGLNAAIHRALGLQHLISEELNRVERVDESVLTTKQLEHLLQMQADANDAWRNRESFLASIVDLPGEIEKLAKTVRDASGFLDGAVPRNLARRLLVAVQKCPEAFASIVVAPSTLGNVLSCENQSKVDLATNIETALLIATMADCVPINPYPLECTVMAALLSDIARIGDNPPSRFGGNAPADRTHPRIGAGWLMVYREFSAHLPRLVANHHERCDGSGFPSGLKACHLDATSRLLSLAGHFVECMNDGKRSTNGESCGRWKSLLWNVERSRDVGEIDARLTNRMLERLSQQIHFEPESQMLGEATGIVTARDRVDAPHRELPEPHVVAEQNVIRAPAFHELSRHSRPVDDNAG